MFDKIMSKLKQFTVCDFMIYETCCVMFGLLIGAQYSNFVMNYWPWFLGILLMTYSWLMYKLFV